MADSNYTVRAILELILKGKGGKDAEKQLKDVEKGGKQAQKSLVDLDASAQQLGRSLRNAVGGAALLMFVKDSITAFAEWERQLGATKSVARDLGLDLEGTTQHAKNLTIAIEEQTGILRQDTTPIFNKFLGLTGDVQQATLLLRAAVGAQEKDMGEMATTASLLGAILTGEVKEPAKSLGIEFDSTRESSEQASEVLQEAIERYTDLGDTVGDTQSALSDMNANSNDVKVTLGEQLAPAVDFVSRALGGAIKFVRSLGAYWGGMVSQAIQGVVGLSRFLVAVFDIDALKSGPAAYYSGVTAVALAEANLQLDIAADTKKKIDDIWSGKSDIPQSDDDAAKAFAELMDKTGAAAAAKDKRRRDEEAEEARKRARKRAIETAQFNQDIQDQILATKIAAAEEGSEQLLELEMEMLRRLREQAVRDAEEKNADILAVNVLFDEMEKQRIDEFNDEKLAKEKETQKEILDFKLAYLAAERKENKETSDFIIAESERVKQEKIAAAFTIANATVALGRELFGEGKAIAIAQVVVDTAAAVMNIQKVWAAYPPVAAVLTALTVATGMAQIRNIRSAEPGSANIGGTAGGGAVPSADTGGAQAIPASPTVIGEPAQQQAQATVVYNFNGPNVIDRATMRQFVRQIDKARRDDRRTRILGAS